MTDKEVTITITGERAAGKTLLARALHRLLANRGFRVIDTDSSRAWDVVVLEFDDADRHALGALGTEPEKAPTLDHSVPDIFGITPPLDLIGRKFRHTGNGKVYEVEGFAWMGEDDVWGFLHREADNPTAVRLVRPLEHLGGRREDGTLRYQEVERNPFSAFLVEGTGLQFLPPSIANMLRALSDGVLTGVVVRDKGRIEAHYQDRPGHVVLETNAAFDVSEERRLRDFTTGAPDWSRRETFDGKLSDHAAQLRRRPIADTMEAGEERTYPGGRTKEGWDQIAADSYARSAHLPED